MAKRQMRRAFTVRDALFLVLACLFAAAIIVPMLARVRIIPNRITCSAHLCTVGKAMLFYASDYEDELPRAGGRESVWSARTPAWMAKDRNQAFDMAPDGTGGRAGISASLYLLVKHAEILPRYFLCIDSEGRYERGASKFHPAKYGIRDTAMTDLWDFGPNPPLHCSYAYQMIYSSHRHTVLREPAMVIAGDRNPWMDSPSTKARDFSRFRADFPPGGATRDDRRYGNAVSHEGDGQNVLFLDSHVEFWTRPFSRVDEDNIYTRWNDGDKTRGVPPALGMVPADPNDSFLVNDPAWTNERE